MIAIGAPTNKTPIIGKVKRGSHLKIWQLWQGNSKERKFLLVDTLDRQHYLGFSVIRLI